MDTKIYLKVYIVLLLTTYFFDCKQGFHKVAKYHLNKKCCSFLLNALSSILSSKFQQGNMSLNLLAQYNTTPSPSRLKLTLPLWGGFPPRSFSPTASARRAQLRIAAKVVRPTDLLNKSSHLVRYWFITD